MAQVVGYFEDNVKYKEGPFVICNPLGNGWRIEVELKGHHCPVLTSLSIHNYCEKEFKLIGKTMDKSHISLICDHLNRMVIAGRIVLKGKSWDLSESLNGEDNEKNS